MVLKNYQPELLYILAERLNMCLKESCLQLVGMSQLWSLYLRMLYRGVQLKATSLLAFFPLFANLWKACKNNSHVDLLVKCVLFSYFKNGSRSSRLTPDLLAVAALTKFKRNVVRTIDTFGSNKKLHSVIKILNYGFIRCTYWVPLLTQSTKVPS